MHHAEHRTFAQPDAVREFPHGRAEIVKVGNGEVGRYTFEPGWRWSNDVKPIAGTVSGHDAWVVGDAPVITVDWFGAGIYATRSESQTGADPA